MRHGSISGGAGRRAPVWRPGPAATATRPAVGRWRARTSTPATATTGVRPPPVHW